MPMPTDTAVELARKMREGRLDPVAVTEAALEAAAACGDKTIFTGMLASRARAEAEAARKRLKAGTPASALDGVPVVWKDLFDIKGRVTTAGSIVLKGAPPAAEDALLVAAGARAGLVAIGCTNMTEFAFSGIGLNPHYGTPLNPCSKGPARSPGGSSSGSAVAVARGIVPIGMGTDTGGSIRAPAAFNGITGYKSSTGHYPMQGVFPLSRTLDTLGPLARSVEDCIAADAALRGLGRHAVTAAPVKGMHIVVPTNVVLDGCEAEVGAAFEASLARLTTAGARIERKPLPALDRIFELIGKHGHLLGAEALHLHWDRVHGPDAARMDRRVVTRILSGAKMTAVDLVAVQETRRQLIAETEAILGDAVVAFPTVAHVAMEMAPLEADDDVFYRMNAKTLRNTMVGNFLDWCGVAMPNGIGSAGMPTSLLLSASHGRDAHVLAAALAVEPLVRVG